jgi:putative addiction module component (TIGR02574 family)
MSPRDAVLQQALTLPDEDRAFLADALERSLSPSAFETEEIAAAWSEEIDRRLAAYDRGEMLAISIEESLREARQVLLERRPEQAKP